MLPWLTSTGNPSSLHATGRRARRAVEESREALAERSGRGRPRSSSRAAAPRATTSRSRASTGRGSRRIRAVGGCSCAVEHHAVLDAAGWLAAAQGADVVELPVDETGRVLPSTLRAVLEADPDAVAVVSVMWANNEVGTVPPVAELAAVAHEFGVPFHTDAVQAVGQLPVSLRGQRRGCDDGDRTQVRRSARRRGSAAASRTRRRTAHARWRSGA